MREVRNVPVHCAAILLHVMTHFSLEAFSILSLSLDFRNVTVLCLDLMLFIFILFEVY